MTTNLQYYNTLKAAYDHLKLAYPEFEEEHSTGWDMMQTLEELMIEYKTLSENDLEFQRMVREQQEYHIQQLNKNKKLTSI